VGSLRHLSGRGDERVFLGYKPSQVSDKSAKHEARFGTRQVSNITWTRIR
jgi:hypothetical protein